VRVSDVLRDIVRWSRHSLTDATAAPLMDTVFASFDLVSCCNVMLYFEDHARRAAMKRLVDSCERGGIVVLGEAEYPPPEFQRFLIPVAEGAHAFFMVR
jgi:chemotaxis methyl-accepting protein methylase